MDLSTLDSSSVQPAGPIVPAFPINMTVSLAVAVFSYYVIEKPFLRLKRYIPRAWGSGGAPTRNNPPETGMMPLH